MKIKLPEKLTRIMGRTSLIAKKYSPEILLTIGVAGTVTSAVMACKATIKAESILEDTKKKLSDIQEVVDLGIDDYTEEDRKKDLSIVYAQTGFLSLLKVYAPAIVLGTISMTNILVSHGIMKKRNAAIAAAYATVEASFKDYRNEVIERFGETVDKELKYNC